MLFSQILQNYLFVRKFKSEILKKNIQIIMEEAGVPGENRRPWVSN
jgi:hypothetical protein